MLLFYGFYFVMVLFIFENQLTYLSCDAVPEWSTFSYAKDGIQFWILNYYNDLLCVVAGIVVAFVQSELQGVVFYNI